MTINYTTLLGLAEPVTGTQSGTWGDDVNKGITDYLDIAIAGTQTISGSQTAVTLSVTNGSSSGSNISQAGSGSTGSAQYAIINCTGNPASLLTVTVPASSRIYHVINATSTSQSVKIVGAGPTTGVTIVSGEKATVVWNGSDYVKISNTAGAGVFSSITNTSLTSGRVVYSTTGGLETDSANLTFDGTTLTAGGLATGGNLTLSGGTANGVAYLNGSKVVTTGSALTFDGTNFATTGGVTLSGRIGFSGFSTDIDNFGLWVSSATSATTLASFSTNPIAFRVNNSEQMRLTSTGLGIGTSSPATQFVVSNAGAQGVEITGSNGSIQVYNRSTAAYGTMNLYANTLYFRTGASPAINMALDASGNLGIGTSSPGEKLEVYGASAGVLRLSTAAKAFNIYTNNSDGTLYFRDVVASANRMALDSSGNLGLGVTPSAWNADYKNFAIGTGGELYGRVSTTEVGIGSNYYRNSGGSYIYLTSAAASYQAQVGGVHYWFTAPSGTAGTAISFTQAMTLDASGNLGVGTTSPSCRVHAFGSGTGASEIRVQNDSSATDSRAMFRAFSNASTYGAGLFMTGTVDSAYATSALALFNFDNQPIVFGTNNSEKMRLDASGNLGLGVTPSAWGGGGGNISLPGGRSITSTTDALNLGSNWYYDGTNFKYASSNYATFYSQASGLHKWFISASGTANTNVSFTQAMTLDASGRLLLGTTTQSGVVTIAGSGWTHIQGNVAAANPSATDPYGLWFGSNYSNGGTEGNIAYKSFLTFASWDGTTYTERARIDSSGNFGIGTSSPGEKLDIYLNSTGNVSAKVGNTTGSIQLLQSNGLAYLYTAANQPIAFSTNNTERARIDSSGSLLVGLTSNTNGYKLLVVNDIGIYTGSDTSGTTTLRLGSSTSMPQGIANIAGIKTAAGSGVMTFNTGSGGIVSEAARIDSSGNLLVGTTSTYGGPGRINVGFNQSTNFGITLRNTSATATGVFVSFENSGGTGNGSISQTNSTTVAYNTSSDRRLKKDIVPAPEAGADIDAIEVVSHGWLSNDDTVKYGVIAQDLNAVAPQAVRQGDSGEEVKETWGVDYSKLVPMLIKEIQSLRARVAQLESN